MIEQNRDLQAIVKTITKKVDDMLEQLKNMQASTATLEPSNRSSDNQVETPASPETNARDATHGNEGNEGNAKKAHEKAKHPSPILGKVNWTDVVT